MALSGETLTADLTLTQDGSYRFWLEPPFGRPCARSAAIT